MFFVLDILTVIIVSVKQCFTIVLPWHTMKTRLTSLYTYYFYHFPKSPKRITLVKRWGCLKIRAPPLLKEVSWEYYRKQRNSKMYRIITKCAVMFYQSCTKGKTKVKHLGVKQRDL